MSSEVDWVLAQLGSVVGSLSVPLRRVNRDESTILDGDIRSRTEDLQQANYVGATLADVATEPRGAEYNLSREAVVGVRIEGLHHSEWGHVDPDGTEGVVWQNGDTGLVDRIRSTLLAERTWPDAGAPDISYTHLEVSNEAPQSELYSDYYRYDFDVVFDGYEDLS